MKNFCVIDNAQRAINKADVDGSAAGTPAFSISSASAERLGSLNIDATNFPGASRYNLWA
jgi:hypothetical protein